jgi:hypothetical protein
MVIGTLLMPLFWLATPFIMLYAFISDPAMLQDIWQTIQALDFQVLWQEFLADFGPMPDWLDPIWQVVLSWFSML